MQLGPEIQDTVESLTIFQRSPQWAAPFEQFRKPVPEPLRFLLREVPLYRVVVPAAPRLDVQRPHPPGAAEGPELGAPGALAERRSTTATASTSRSTSSPSSATAPTCSTRSCPTYPPFGKRMLMDNGWYRMLRNDDVELVTEPIAEIGADRVVTADGSEYEADVLVIATGFDVLRFLTPFEARGRVGPHAARGVGRRRRPGLPRHWPCPDFPNLFMPLRAEHAAGPRRQPDLRRRDADALHHRACCAQMIDRGHRRASRSARTSTTTTTRRSTRAHENMVWTHPGMSTYYRNDRGPGGRQLPVPQRRPVRAHHARRPGRLHPVWSKTGLYGGF